ncbi:MAG: hypothetical protein K2X93_05790 [Candidatus Obscuribacterales bacterium]|nr:hypothetical protein [Candidatus Obscuribacterales bacterium]
MTNCTFVTYSKLPNLDPDDKIVFDILTSRGVDCQIAVWDDPSIDWSKAGVTVIRSTWDYIQKFDQFMDWIDHVSNVTELFNRPNYLRWSSHKSYLRDLSEAGIGIVPTEWLYRFGSVDVKEKLMSMLKNEPSGKLVVKPAIGLATSGVIIVQEENIDAAVKHTEDLLRTVDVMVQPFIASVKTRGERALVFVNGRYCHTVRKMAFQKLMPGGEAGEMPVEVTFAELELAERAMLVLGDLVRKHEKNPNRLPALDAVAGGGMTTMGESNEEAFLSPPLYARIDLVHAEDGTPMIIELELVEPSLWLTYYPITAELFADAIEHAIKRTNRREPVTCG